MSTTASTITVRILSVVGGESLATLTADTLAVRPARFESLFRAHHGAGADVPADVSTDASWAGSDADVQSAHEALVSDLFDAAARIDAMDTERPCYVLFEGAGADGEDVWSRCEIIGEEHRESECDDEIECAYCGRTHTPPSAVPALDDDDAWTDMAREHADYCEWILTRAHRVEVVRVFQVDHESSDDGWANDAYAILRDSGVWVREGVDGCCSWEECSGRAHGEEYVTMRVGSIGAALDALVEHGFVVRADTAE